jgi:Cache domain
MLGQQSSPPAAVPVESVHQLPRREQQIYSAPLRVRLQQEAAMPLDKSEVRVSLQKLLIILTLILVPLNLIGLYLTMESHGALEQTTGTLLRDIAQSNAIAARQFIDDRVANVAAIAAQPSVLDAIIAANLAFSQVKDTARTAKIADTENKWSTAEVDALVASMLASRASAWLRHYRELDPRFMKLIILDANGVPVAATDKPAHYAPVDEVFWQGVSAKGTGAVYVTQVISDGQGRANYIGIGFPVLDEGSRRFIGAVHALVDVSTLFALLNREQPGRTTVTMLVKQDGTIISAPNVSPAMQMKSEEYGAVRDALGTLQGLQAGFVIAGMRGGNRIVGFADTGLTPIYSNLSWFVMVSQSEREALAPVRTVGYFAILMVIVGLLMVTLLAAYFFLHRAQELAEIEVREKERFPQEHHEEEHAGVR